MLRRLVIIFLALTLSWTAVACGSSSQSRQQAPDRQTAIAPTQIADGRYPVQQATYNDGDGTYSLMLLDTPPGTPPTYRTSNLQMARLTDEAIAKGEKTYLEVSDKQAVMYLTEDFRLEYVHNVTETQTDSQTGQPQTAVVRQESSFWTPFAGALAGQALGSLLFSPQYYVPPAYQPGRVMTGYGGYGNSYDRAVGQYRNKYGTAPAVEKNRQVLRKTGNLRTAPSSSAAKRRKTPPSATKSTGSGYGSSKLRTSDRPSRSQRRSSFGSSSPRRTKSFGSSGARRRR